MPPDERKFVIITPDDGLPFCLSDTTPPIGWDVCASCGLHILICTHDVPVEPSYVRREPGTSVANDYRYEERALSAPIGRWDRTVDRALAKHGVLGLVDQDMVNKVKAASEARDGSE